MGFDMMAMGVILWSSLESFLGIEFIERFGIIDWIF